MPEMLRISVHVVVGMKSTAKLQASILALSAVIVISLFAITVLAPSVLWTSNSDWSGGAFKNTTNITGGLMLNNTIVAR